jgi:hypothetical protein
MSGGDYTGEGEETHVSILDKEIEKTIRNQRTNFKKIVQISDAEKLHMLPQVIHVCVHTEVKKNSQYLQSSLGLFFTWKNYSLLFSCARLAGQDQYTNTNTKKILI